MTSSPHAGLTAAQASARLLEFGHNELPSSGGRSLQRIVLETMREPMFLLLLGASVLYLLLGDLAEGLFLTAGAVLSVGLVIVQESRSERALAALQQMAQPMARVLRDDAELRVAARELVPGDLLLIGEGERLPADGILIGGDMLSVDESALTGESAPVTKTIGQAEAASVVVAPGIDAVPQVFAGTLVVRGQGSVLVSHTGERSALGRIGRSLADIKHELTPLQQTAGRVVGILGIVALAFCALVASAYGLLREDWVGGALAGVTVAISLIPEEFPMVLAIFLALGAWRLAQHKVLTRRSAVIESLGAATVLCVDKTGTLTANRMQVARLYTTGADEAVGSGLPIGQSASGLLHIAALASAVHPVDPMDKAVLALARASTHGPPLPSHEPERIWPLSAGLLAVTQRWQLGHNNTLVATKGAPEAIFGLCQLPATTRVHLLEVIQRYAEQGLRILGAAAAHGPTALADDPQRMRFEFAGLIGFIDPLRADVPAALDEARHAGIRVIMITGDHPATALAIARTAGIETRTAVVTGTQIGASSPAALRAMLQHARVFARITPEQKLLIVEALKANDEVVAMTGDGVNDAPALETAHIGIAMGLKGTDVAREAADLVLLDDSFASIVGGVRLGRRIFANLRRALTYIAAIHIPIAGLALLPVLMGLPPILFPLHVVLLELAIDPLCALVFENEPSEGQAMRQPPRDIREPLFGFRQIRAAVLQGLVVLVAVFGLYAWCHAAMLPEAVARAAAFIALVTANLVLALADSAASMRWFAAHRRIFWSIALAVCIVLAVILGIPAVGAVFQITAPSWPLLAAAIGIGIVSGGWPLLAQALHSRQNVAT